jgi:hypothetical protein
MPGKCKFLNKWLEQPQYHAWLRNKTTSLKPGDGITLMRIFDMSGKILENTVL